MGKLSQWGPAEFTPTAPPDVRQEFDDVGRGYYSCPGMDLQTSGGSGDADKHPHIFRFPTTKENANLISSECADGLHRPVLDFDFPVRYVASTTPGHGHLYIDRPMTWERYEKLLQTMEECGLLEPGYVTASIERKATFVRPEWVKKSAPLPESPASPDYSLSDLLEEAGV